MWGADDHLGAPDASNDESTGVTMDGPSSESGEIIDDPREPEIGGALRHFLSIRVEEDGREREREGKRGSEKGKRGSEGKSGDDGASSPTANGTPSIVVEDAARNLTITESLELLFERISADHPRHELRLSAGHARRAETRGWRIRGLDRSHPARGRRRSLQRIDRRFHRPAAQTGGSVGKVWGSAHRAAAPERQT